VYRMAVLKSRKRLNNKKTWSKLFSLKNNKLFFSKNNFTINLKKTNSTKTFFIDIYGV